jgi:hypothetical protein
MPLPVRGDEAFEVRAIRGSELGADDEDAFGGSASLRSGRGLIVSSSWPASPSSSIANSQAGYSLRSDGVRSATCFLSQVEPPGSSIASVPDSRRWMITSKAAGVTHPPSRSLRNTAVFSSTSSRPHAGHDCAHTSTQAPQNGHRSKSSASSFTSRLQRSVAMSRSGHMSLPMVPPNLNPRVQPCIQDRVAVALGQTIVERVVGDGAHDLAKRAPPRSEELRSHHV